MLIAFYKSPLPQAPPPCSVLTTGLTAPEAHSFVPCPCATTPTALPQSNPTGSPRPPPPPPHLPRLSHADPPLAFMYLVLAGHQREPDPKQGELDAAQDPGGGEQKGAQPLPTPPLPAPHPCLRHTAPRFPQQPGPHRTGWDFSQACGMMSGV